MRFLFGLGTVASLLAAGVPCKIMAQPSDHHTIELRSYGMGHSHPHVSSVSDDPNWLVYVFERDSIVYYQVNDLVGRVHVIVARVDGAFWTLPAGVERSRVSLPSRRVLLPESAVASVVYRHPEFSLLRYVVEGEAVWSIESSNMSR